MWNVSLRSSLGFLLCLVLLALPSSRVESEERTIELATALEECTEVVQDLLNANESLLIALSDSNELNRIQATQLKERDKQASALEGSLIECERRVRRETIKAAVISVIVGAALGSLFF